MFVLSIWILAGALLILSSIIVISFFLNAILRGRNSYEKTERS